MADGSLIATAVWQGWWIGEVPPRRWMGCIGAFFGCGLGSPAGISGPNRDPNRNPHRGLPGAPSAALRPTAMGRDAAMPVRVGSGGRVGK